MITPMVKSAISKERTYLKNWLMTRSGVHKAEVNVKHWFSANVDYFKSGSGTGKYYE